MRRLKLFPLILLLFLISFKAEPQDPPGLIVVIVVDELDNEQVLLLQREFSDRGINRIAREGMRFMSAVSPDISGYPGTKMASLFSGTLPASHGVIAETWLDRRSGWFVEPASYDSARIESVLNYNQCKSLADYLKSVYGPGAKSATIGIHSPWMIHSVGYSPDYIFAFDQQQGKFYNALFPNSFKDEWMKTFNEDLKHLSLQNRQWGPVKDVTTYAEYRYLPEDAKSEFRSFMYNMRTFTDQPYSRVAASPYANTLLRDFTVSFLSNTDFGKSKVPNLLTIGFTSRPFVTTNKTLLPVEKEDMLLRLDQDIASLVAFLDFEYGKENYLLVFTAAANSAPDQTTAGKPGVTTGTVEFRRVSALLNLFLMAKHGQGQWVLGIYDNFVYLNHPLIEENNLNLREMQELAAGFIMEFSGVKLAMPTENMQFDLEKAPLYAANLFLRRMPDVVISLLPGWKTQATEAGSRQTGTSGHNYVPVYLRGWKTQPGAWIESVGVSEFVPMILQQLGINHPEGVKIQSDRIFR